MMSAFSESGVSGEAKDACSFTPASLQEESPQDKGFYYERSVVQKYIAADRLWRGDVMAWVGGEGASRESHSIR